MTETALAATPAQPMRQTAPGSDRALDAVPVEPWTALAASAVEPNVFFDPAYALAAARFAQGGVRSDALAAWRERTLVGLLPVSSALRTYGLPIPAMISSQPYTVLGTPLLSSDQTEEAAAELLAAAGRRGVHLLALHMVDLEGSAMRALEAVAARQGLAITIHSRHERAALKVPDDAEAYLRNGMGSKRLKDLRRQRHRLDEEGEVLFAVHREPQAISDALERFLRLEAAGWKGRRGTGLGQNDGDARYISEAALGLAPRHGFEILEMTLAGKTIAAGLVLRQQATAMFFKIAFDEAFARYSPGVQLTVELTRRMSEDPTIGFVDSCALPGHPMIDHVWRERRQIGDVLIATRKGPVATLCARLIMARAGLREHAKRLFLSIKTAAKTRETRK